jgi:Trypsin-like peptidase domain
MFIKAIEEIQKFTRPIHTITRYYGSNVAVAGSGTFFFVNGEGIAITCKHVAANIINSDATNERYRHIKKEKDSFGTKTDGKYKKQVAALEAKYGLVGHETIIQVKNNIMDAFDLITAIDCIMHPTLDLAILQFRGFTKILYSNHAVFLKDGSAIKQGKYLCRYGYPFPEFNNFRYDLLNDDIEFTATGTPGTPAFPMDGIVTRHISDGKELIGIEMSTPGLRGQSGGPLFDTDGLVYGMQYATNHLHLGFDMKNKEVISAGKKLTVTNQPFLHVGLCVHVDRIKEFLRLHAINFYEA